MSNFMGRANRGAFAEAGRVSAACFYSISTSSSTGSDDLPAIASDTDTHAHTRRPEADAGTRTVVPIVVAAALDVALARRIIVGIPDDHAAAAAGPITAPILIADQANRLYHRKGRIRVFAGGVDISGMCASCK